MALVNEMYYLVYGRWPREPMLGELDGERGKHRGGLKESFDTLSPPTHPPTPS